MIDEELLVALDVTIEPFEDGFIAFDRKIDRYGEGATEAAAIADYLEVVDEYFEMLRNHSGGFSPRIQGHLELLNKLFLTAD